jgi:predicted amino acid-binding ACT domain protein
VNENCKLIIAFFPLTDSRVERTSVERILRSHPVRVERIEETEKGVLIFAESTNCESLELTRMREQLFEQGRAAGYRVRLQRECLFRAMHSLVLNF